MYLVVTYLHYSISSLCFTLSYSSSSLSSFLHFQNLSCLALAIIKVKSSSRKRESIDLICTLVHVNPTYFFVCMFHHFYLIWVDIQGLMTISLKNCSWIIEWKFTWFSPLFWNCLYLFFLQMYGTSLLLARLSMAEGENYAK